MKSIGEKLRLLRESFGLTQEEVANKLNLTRNIVVNIENDKRSIKCEELYDFAKLYKISMEEIISDENELDVNNQLFIEGIEKLSKKDKEEIVNLINFKINYKK